MKKTPKLIGLFLILALPVFLFLFLKFFGRNEYTIETFYESGVPTDTLGCEFEPEAPYRVKLSQQVNGIALILLDGGEKLMATSDRNNIIRRIQQNAPGGVNLFIYYNKDLGAPIPLEGVFYIPKSEDSWGTLRCLFVTSEDNQLILLDDQRKIRGYYGLELEEVDRLLVELEILTLL